MTQLRVVFTPSGLDGTVEPGTTVLAAARRLGVDLDSVCGGRGICGRCQVEPSIGTHVKWGVTVGAEAISAPGTLETEYRGNRPLAGGHRLGCSAVIEADVVIDVPASSQVHRQVVRKDLDMAEVAVDPRFSLFYLDVAVRELGDSGSAAGWLVGALSEQHGIEATGVDPNVLRRVHRALDANGGEVTVAVERRAGRAAGIVAVWSGYIDAAYGIAVDVGSTTVAGHLCDLASGEVLASGGRMNPQIRYGEDLMSRVSYVMMNPGGEVELTSAIRTALNQLIGELVDQAATSRDRVLEVVLVGNPIMHHIVLGIDPTPLGSAPFVLATDEAVAGPASALDLDLPQGCYYIGPCIAGHVGADTAAVILAEGPHRGEAMSLVVDVGTNAEIVLGNSTRQFAASSPTGPAFEGAQISCGQRATRGAIERVRIDPETLEPRFKVIGSDLWSDDSAFAAATRDLEIAGVCGSGIIEVVAQMYLTGIVDGDGTIRANANPRVVPHDRTHSYLLHQQGQTQLFITQNDVRAIQLAKAALRAGIDLLIEHAGSPPVHDIRLAGAFGTHIDPLHAMVLGLVPDSPLRGVRSVGNAAGVGAVQALLSEKARREMEQAVRDVVKIETATEPRFQELFVAAMAFPHAKAPTPYLAAEVQLPAPTGPRSPERAGGRRRRRSRAPAEPAATQEVPT